MSKTFVGKQREKILRGLLDTWLKSGPPVCFLQGFPGVGKTDLARDFRDLARKQGWTQAVTNEVPDSTTPPTDDTLVELAISLSDLGLPGMEKALSGQGDHIRGKAVEKALEQPVLIILDEAQRFFGRDSGKPWSKATAIFEYLRNRPNLPGRLLLLSDRVVEKARWSEWIPVHTLPELEQDEAVTALELKIQESGISVEISAERRREIVRDLNFNPRAIEALVGALRYETLDEIIKSNPGLWATQDRDISKEFLAALERELLQRTMKHLTASFRQKLSSLSVYRRGFTRDILRQLCSDDDDETLFRNVLVDRFLATLYRDYLSLHPILREISLAHLRDEDKAGFRHAHSMAADYFIRHFRAKQITLDNSKLGEAFAELRHHLSRAHRTAELREVDDRFTNHLKRHFKWVTPIPTDPDELDERIGVLTVLLEEGGSKGLEFHLASCLSARNRLSDAEEALKHAERSTGREAPEESWLLLGKLSREVRGVEPAIIAAKRGLRILKDSAPLYHFVAEALVSAGKKDDAVALLTQGIEAVPPEKNRVSLYQRCAELLAKDGKADEAIELLRVAKTVIPPDKGLFSLYQMLGTIHCRAGQPEAAIASHLEGMQRMSGRIDSYKLAEAALFLAVALDDEATVASLLSAQGNVGLGAPQISLGRVLQHQMHGLWQKAAEVSAAARRLNDQYFHLAVQESFSRLATDDPGGARKALFDFPKLTFGIGEPHGWLATFIHLRRGDRSEASLALTKYLGRAIDERSELNEYFLLRLWDEQVTPPNDKRICFYFPIMPPFLTDLGKPFRRVPFARPVLPPDAGFRPRTAEPVERAATTPDIYVSYAWGEDTSPEGRKREEIVNLLCGEIRRNGYEIKRDKDHMQGGDLIDEFTDDISRAARIVAVISEKSLNSKYCMARELFSAYRRCNYRRTEFQEKVIALVMDDALKYLNDDPPVLLSAQWQSRLENARRDLARVDPRRNSQVSWNEVDLQEDMVSHLPEMIGALNNVKMLRGFDAIVANGFREVLERLP